MTLIVREAQKFEGGMGCLTYDSVYRQKNQGVESGLDTLDSSLHTAYIGGPAVPTVPPCRHCRGG